MNWMVLLASCVVVVQGDVIKPIHLDDPELYNEWSSPRDLLSYKTYVSGAEFVGNLFAGRAEFPWIVDIRWADGDADTWSTGNLISTKRVLCSARAVGYWVSDDEYYRDFPDEKGKGLVDFEKRAEVKVSYCATYLWEDYKYIYYRDYKITGAETRTPETGSRTVSVIIVHDKASNSSMLYDVAMLKLKQEIKPIADVVAFMPVWMDPNLGILYAPDMSQMEAERRICYVASFGRDFVNNIDHYAIDYKVKYRVYWVDPETCMREVKHYQRTLISFEAHVDVVDDFTLECYRSRARVGTVCDHDRGAPLVCDDRVYGLVSRGANQSFCNNLRPMTFTVGRAAHIWPFYKQHVGKVDDDDAKARATSVTQGLTISIFLLSFI